MPTPFRRTKASRRPCGPDMSLLLDALQRASQEKEKLAEERAATGKPSEAPGPVASEPLPPLAIDFAPGDSAAPDALAVPAEPSAPAVAAAPYGLAAEQTAEPAVEMTLDPMERSTTETSSVLGLVPPAQSAEPAMKSAQRQEYPLESATVQREPAPPTGPAKSAAPAAPAHPSPAMSPQVAREILGATAKPSKRGPNRRLIVLGVLALLVAVANAAFFFGFLDKFLDLSGPALAPAISPPPLATLAIPPSTPVQAVAAEGQGGSEPSASPDVKADADQATSAAIAASTTSSSSRIASRRDEDSVAAPSVVARAAPARAPARGKPRGTTATRAVTPVFVAKPAPVSVLDSAYAALTEGRFDDATEAYNRVLQKNPGERDALLGLAYIAQRQGHRDEARTYYQRVLRQEPGHPGANAGLLSIAAEGDLQLTASRAREMAERNPGSAVVLSTLGGILAREGRIGEAQQAYFKALTLEPDNALHAYNLAVALDRLHKYTQAQGYYQRALALAEKSGAGERANFPRQEALQRLEQLRAREGAAEPLVAALPDSRAR